MKRMALLLCLVGCTQGPGPVRRFSILPSASAVDVVGSDCQSPTENITITFEKTDGGPVPNVPLVGRRSITICSDPRNALLTTPPYIKCRADGHAATPGDTPGMVLSSGDCISYALGYQQPVYCLSNQPDAGIQSLECK